MQRVGSGEVDQYIGVYELVRRLKEEILQPHQGHGPALFELDRAEVEIEFGVKRDARGKIVFSVLALGGSQAVGRTHKVRLSLLPARVSPPGDAGGPRGGQTLQRGAKLPERDVPASAAPLLRALLTERSDVQREVIRFKLNELVQPYGFHVEVNAIRRDELKVRYAGTAEVDAIAEDTQGG